MKARSYGGRGRSRFAGLILAAGAAAALLGIAAGCAPGKKMGADPLPPFRERIADIRKVSEHGVSFAVLGDSKNHDEVFAPLLDAIDGDPDVSFVVFTGDLVPRPLEADYRKAMRTLRRHLHKPFVAVPGNHDVTNGEYGLFLRYVSPRNVAFKAGGTRFVLLDDAEGIDAETKEWLERTLAAAGEGPVLAFMHVPFDDPRGGEHHHCLAKEQADALAEIFRRNGVFQVFSGHIHGYLPGSYKGITSIITGGAGAELYGEDPAHFFYHYLRVRMAGRKAAIQVVPLPSGAGSETVRN